MQEPRDYPPGSSEATSSSMHVRQQPFDEEYPNPLTRIPFNFKVRELIPSALEDGTKKFYAQYVVTPFSWPNFLTNQIIEVLGFTPHLVKETHGPLKHYQFIWLVLSYRGTNAICKFYILESPQEMKLGADSAADLGFRNVHKITNMPPWMGGTVLAVPDF